MAHIAIIGAGVGGVPCAYELRRRLGKQHRITLLGSSPFFEFTPSNPWVAVGWRTREKTRVELRDPLESKGIQWLRVCLQRAVIFDVLPKAVVRK